MDIFLWPIAFILLPFPWFVARVIKPIAKESNGGMVMALRVPFFNDLLNLGAMQNRPMSRRALFFLTLSWIFTIIALARPVVYEKNLDFIRPVRNIVMAIDVSGSMNTRDFMQNISSKTRLDAVKQVADRFIEKRASDRVGIVLFGSGAYVYTPLSSDGQTVRELLKEIGFGIVDTERTALGEGLALAVQQALTSPEKTRAIILLSDGYSNAGTVTPKQAAEVAKRHGIKIYAIGLGGEVQTVNGFFGPVLVDPSKDLDEETLNAVALMTGGTYFRAKNESDLEKIYEAIDTLETTDETSTLRPRHELFFWFLVGALICLVITLFYREKVS